MKRRARRHACALCAGRKLTHIELRHVGLVCLLYEGKPEEMPQGRQVVRWCALIGEHCRRPSEAEWPLLGWACASDSGVVLRRMVISCDDCFRTRSLVCLFSAATGCSNTISPVQRAQPRRSRGLREYALRVKLEASSLTQPRAGCVEIGLLGAEQHWSFAWSVGGKPSQEPRGCHRKGIRYDGPPELIIAMLRGGGERR
jgi:hypothetical protein